MMMTVSMVLASVFWLIKAPLCRAEDAYCYVTMAPHQAKKLHTRFYKSTFKIQGRPSHPVSLRES